MLVKMQNGDLLLFGQGGMYGVKVIDKPFGKDGGVESVKDLFGEDWERYYGKYRVMLFNHKDEYAAGYYDTLDTAESVRDDFMKAYQDGADVFTFLHFGKGY